MDFTIITPNLNYGRFLGDCMSSVAGQEGVRLEHLIFDGGSTDESADVAAQFPTARWFAGPDAGMSDAINKGFDRATGDWVMWLNADDRLKPGALASLKSALQTSMADVVYGNYDFVDAEGRFLRTMRVPRWSAFVNIHHHCYVPSTAAFYRRRSVIEGGHRLRTDFHYVMDGEFYVRLARRGMSFAHVPLNLADFRLHGANASMRHLPHSRDMDDILKTERQHIESRAIRRAYGITVFRDPYHVGLVDGVLSIVARGMKGLLKLGC